MRYEVRGTRSFSSLAAYRAPHAAYRLTGTKKRKDSWELSFLH